MSKVHWLALMSVQGIGGVTVRKLLERFGSVEAVFDAPAEELEGIPRVTSAVIERLQAVDFEVIENELASMDDAGLSIVAWDDDDYPANLRPVNDAPPLLFVYGRLLESDSRAAAIVGTREPSPRAAALAERLALALAERGVTIVSGLALGIDGAAHRGALQAEDGRTLAVLGSGLRSIFPREHIELAESVAEHGAVLSELRPNTPASGPSLMARDRIVSGLSRVVIVIEARASSGTMDTARRAQAQGRPIFALPGSAGTDLLLQQGAVRLDAETPDVEAIIARIDESGEAGGAQLGLF